MWSAIEAILELICLIGSEGKKYKNKVKPQMYSKKTNEEDTKEKIIDVVSLELEEIAVKVKKEAELQEFKMQKPDANKFFTSKNVLNGIIMSEILSKPKSLR